MRILFLTHGFNSLTQRLLVELGERGHEVAIEFDISDAVTEEAVALWRPELVIAPYLRRKIPERVYREHTCLVVHPGIVGDRGPSALDWAIQEGEARWGVTVLQANEVMDGGDVWAHEEFAMPGEPLAPARKSSVYRNEVTEAAVRAVLEALDKHQAGRAPRPLADFGAEARGRLRPLITQDDRRIDWAAHDTATVLRRIAAADGFPGVRDELFGEPCFLYDARAAVGLGGPPGQLLGRRGDGIVRATSDGAIFLGHVRRPEASHPFKLPLSLAFREKWSALPLLPDEEPARAPIRYEEEDGVGYLHFDLYNGAMATADCERVRAALEAARDRGPRVLVLLGGRDFFGNGIHLNVIEAAASAADESWQNIVAMDDLALAVLTATNAITISALVGNAGAGGAFLALAADRVWARRGVILNPHYKNMGNLYGSEYWTYLLPRRVGKERARAVMERRLPVGAEQAVREGLADACFGDGVEEFERMVRERARELARSAELPALLEAKARRRASDEAERPLASYRDAELAEMRRNFYGFDPSYHYARHHFVHKVPMAWTPRHLARHRDPSPRR